MGTKYDLPTTNPYGIIPKKGLKMKKILLTIIACFCLILLAETGIDENINMMLNDISDGSHKIILAKPIENGTIAELHVYEKMEDNWILNLQVVGFFGRNGVIANKKEGDGATPLGVYTFGRAFGVEDDPGSILPYTKLTDNDVWVDDVSSVYYNQWQSKNNPDADWKSAEDLAKYDIAYKYVLTINYNTKPIVAGLGSAIFLHCSTDRPTAGCISVPEEAMIYLLGFVDGETKIAILK